MIKAGVSNRTRYYNTNKLESWTQNHCKVCGRFLSRFERLYCKIHRNLGRSRKYISKKGNRDRYNSWRRE